MKNVNIMGVQRFLGEGVTKKTIYGELPKKRVSDNLQESWEKIGMKVFLRGVDTSMHTMT